MHDAIREIVEKVVIHPQGPYKPVEIEIYGEIAALLRMSERAAADPLESRGVLVAGTRNTLTNGFLGRGFRDRNRLSRQAFAPYVIDIKSVLVSECCSCFQNAKSRVE
ncbi:hypothetical protein UP10_36980 [Bradyrhizobium sp. LTSPM299]|nr:hypothetical protein UP10_36980 [Bradyrhizobium sp. LTSPM299]